MEPVAGCGSTLDALHQTVVWAWSHAKSRMLAVWGIADIGHHQPGWRGATDRFPVNWTGGFDPERSRATGESRHRYTGTSSPVRPRGCAWRSIRCFRQCLGEQCRRREKAKDELGDLISEDLADAKKARHMRADRDAECEAPQLSRADAIMRRGRQSRLPSQYNNW